MSFSESRLRLGLRSYSLLCLPLPLTVHCDEDDFLRAGCVLSVCTGRELSPRLVKPTEGPAQARGRLASLNRLVPRADRGSRGGLSVLLPSVL